ncbi:LuxR C-terminal-related transcriptional regulator [Streptomyces sp. NPDC048337]|uniref:LuxR C-terminal-related transcriptional regulator n=1 Tax=Streptomyces sp. NPDC048337 TaxID=3365535 RepID=UPI003714218C
MRDVGRALRSPSGPALQAAQKRAVRAGQQAATPVTLFEEAVPEVAVAMPFDLWAGVLLDPVTLLNTGGCFRHGVSAQWMPRMLDIEYREGDANQMPALAKQSMPVGSLASSLDGRLERSVRYRDIYRPLGLGDEMRVVLRDAGRVWGALVLARAADRPPFSDAELAFAAGLSAPLGRALRRSLVAPTRAMRSGTSGIALLAADYSVISTSSTAAAWFAELAEEPARGGGLPASAYSVAAAARRSESGGSRACVRTRTGGWAALEGWRLEAHEEPRVALSIGPAAPSDQVEALIKAYALTPRECAVLTQVLRGASTKEISHRLRLSEYTVQDHLKAIFDKTGVRSRRELMGHVFFRHYLPDIGLPNGPHAPVA